MAVAVGDPVILARMPGYRVATTSVTSDSSAITTEAQVASVSGSLISGVIYRVVFNGLFQSTSAADASVHVQVREDNTSGTILNQVDFRLLNSVSQNLVLGRVEAQYTAASTASKTFVATATRSNGTGTLVLNAGATFPSLFYIEVIG